MLPADCQCREIDPNYSPLSRLCLPLRRQSAIVIPNIGIPSHQELRNTSARCSQIWRDFCESSTLYYFLLSTLMNRSNEEYSRHWALVFIYCKTNWDKSPFCGLAHVVAKDRYIQMLEISQYLLRGDGKRNEIGNWRENQTLVSLLANNIHIPGRWYWWLAVCEWMLALNSWGAWSPHFSGVINSVLVGAY